MDNLDFAQRAYHELGWVARGCWLHSRGFHFARHEHDDPAGQPFLSIWADRSGTESEEELLFIRQFLLWLETGDGPAPRTS